MAPPTNNRLVCPILDLNPSRTPVHLYEDEIAYFNSIPWTAALLSAEGVIPYIPCCRNPVTDVHDQLFGRSLSNDRCVPHLLSFFAPDSLASARDPKIPILENETLFAVGDGVSGYPSVVHGGMIAAMMDESLGALFELNSTLEKDLTAFKSNNVTGGLDITYLKPVSTNTVVRIRNKVEESVGRKTRIYTEVVSEAGEVLAKCTSRWVALKPKI